MGRKPYLENRKKSFTEVLPRPVTKLIRLHTVVVYISHMLGHVGGCQNAQKQFIIKVYYELILYKPVGKYQFTLACFRTLVMIAYQAINCLISQPTYVVGTQKNRHNETVLLSTIL